MQAQKTTFRDVFAVTEFRALWGAQLLSVVGDQLARVALTLLVYDRTRSAFLAAVTFVVSIVPTFVGGVTLAGLADRYPRRRVMIVCDLARCALVLVMAIPRMPLAAMVILLFVVTLAGAPFTSARAAVFPDVLAGDSYVIGNAIMLTTTQIAQVIGFAAGGAIVGFFHTGPSLLVDAATYAVSAAIARIWVLARPASSPGRNEEGTTSRLFGIITGARLVFANPTLRTSMLLGWLAAFYDAPEGVAAPLGRSLGGGSVTVGMLLAFEVLGASIGSLVFGRAVSPARRLRVMGPLAVAACAVLTLFAFSLPLLPDLLILAVSGVFTCFQLGANAAFVQAAPAEQRSQAFGLAVGGMSLGQGLVMILAGAAAEHYAPSAVIAVAGGLGAITATVLALSWHANMSRRDQPSSQDRQLSQHANDERQARGSGPVAGTHGLVLPVGRCGSGTWVVQVQLPVRMRLVLSGGRCWGQSQRGLGPVTGAHTASSLRLDDAAGVRRLRAGVNAICNYKNANCGHSVRPTSLGRRYQAMDGIYHDHAKQHLYVTLSSTGNDNRSRQGAAGAPRELGP
ncbi:MAG: MFS transporter [Streptosporangiaceae bacterium]